jgi:hypothetical protein
MKNCIALALLFLIAGCTTVQAQSVDTIKYKHYTGTVGTEPITADLFIVFSGNDLGASGSYYYNNKSVLLDLSGYGKDSSQSPTQWQDETIAVEEANIWAVSAADKNFEGTWASHDGKRTTPIHLTENYTAGSYPLKVINTEEQIVYVKELTLYDSSNKPTNEKTNVTTIADASWIVAAPAEGTSKQDADFITSAEIKAVGGDSIHATTINGLMESCNHNFYGWYNNWSDSFHISSPNDTDTYELTQTILPIFNENGMLILQYTISQPQALIPATPTYFFCLDVREKKIWKAGDVFAKNEEAVAKLLDAEARKRFHIQAGKGINSMNGDAGQDENSPFIVDKIPFTDNIYFTETGVTFCYQHLEIAYGNYGEMQLFLPYSKLKPYLTPAFKARMGIKA